ncbi:nucleotidyl transferase AbiEii/AbiGii toxin family protein [uncultured Alistipes sp.]|uniref:nucleotidyl transferase AbiEii/AbiGii toxin family protein n=1 Tax=Alistipes ihumii TaxID=1470347 RepID=UPI0025966681|nr:nucleotidyl transferase AbiEii/AbiGii toxin family protein [uncultured Alistipes sp.]
MEDSYKKQTSLLLDLLPEIAKEDVFALHGGTAINLFCLNMPRLSVDIDLTYIQASDDRNADLREIRSALERVKDRLGERMPLLHFDDPERAGEELKLICTSREVTVKIEVNQINRGIIGGTEFMVLCDKAQETFDKFCEVRVVPHKQLWGGKIVAALDRQHPRDLFDVGNLLRMVGYTPEIKEGTLFFLLCSKRPIAELLNPNMIDQSAVLESQFGGMTDHPFGYGEYKTVRAELIKTVNASLTPEDKEFLLSFSSGSPKWEGRDYGRYPAVRWKLLNICRLKESNPEKYVRQLDELERTLHAGPQRRITTE